MTVVYSGAISNFDPDTVVEVPAYIGAQEMKQFILVKFQFFRKD